MRPAMQQHTLDEVKAALKKQNNDAVADPLFVASEGVVSAAYSGPLARPALWSGADIDHHTLADFHSTVRAPRPAAPRLRARAACAPGSRRWQSAGAAPRTFW